MGLRFLGSTHSKRVLKRRTNGPPGKHNKAASSVRSKQPQEQRAKETGSSPCISLICPMIGVVSDARCLSSANIVLCQERH